MLTILIMMKMGLVEPAYGQTVLHFLDSGLMRMTRAGGHKTV